MSIWEAFGKGRYKGFSREAGLLLDEAVELAGGLGCKKADTGHLLLAMLQTDHGPAAKFLAGKNISELAVRRQLGADREGPALHLDRKALAPDLKRAMDYALIGAQNAHLAKAEPEHLLCAMLTELIQSYRPVAGADILFPSDEKVIGKCPRCGSKIVERSKGYFCTNRDCKFVLWRESRFFTLKQKTLDRKTAAKLLEKGKAPLKGCVSPRTGQVYDATVLLEDDGTRPSFKLVFGNG